ncbi:MAG: D-alanyl-D-alanine carboxypeptidase [Defluviitaleaceae bacterium]|nr:D-alanyl-D-alanine carboxypeptidase [Defluviitaleaceae bacterium]
MERITGIFQIVIALYLVFFNISTLYATTISETEAELELTRPNPPALSATSAIVIDAQSGFILHEKNIHTPLYPASIVKVMTALLALEQYGTRLDERISFSRNAVYTLPPNSSHIAMNAYETLSMEDALYALMLASANEVANAIAEHISGDIPSFVDMMNRRAIALGAINTQFGNPSGLHDPIQVTTAYDMALITKEALRYPKFRELISTVRHDIEPTERQPLVRELLNSNRMIRTGQHFNENVIGGKPGFTTPAQHTLVTYAEKDGRALIVVTMQGEGGRLYTDTRDLLNYAFAIPYVEQQIFSINEYAKTLPVYTNWSSQREFIGEVQLVVPEDVFLTLPLGFDVAELEQQILVPGRLVIPVQENDYIGRIVYSMRGIPMGDIELKALNAVLAPIEEPDEPIESYSEIVYVTGGDYEFPSFNLEELAENYYLSIILPLIIFFSGLLFSIGIFKMRRLKRQSKLGRYSVIGSHIYRYRR